ncbi:MAG: type II toxin-antitoxin system Phd/YefM family antitoxin [Magnetococcales bacterium]|nr:type II toxin-antitoxin system Phd/YefM family antitoxin [Magnetococcales bacterium]
MFVMKSIALNFDRIVLNGPVFITDHGRPAYVLLTFDEYKRITGKRTKIADLLAMSGIEDIEFEIPQFRDVAQPEDFF